MARWDDPDSATSSFSIMLGAASHLDGKYSVFGELVDGEETLRKIEAVETKREGIFVMPIERVEIEATYIITPDIDDGAGGECEEDLRECMMRADSLAQEIFSAREKLLPGN
jgi:hypothetical protein